MKTNKLLGLLPVSLLSVFALSGCDNNEETRVLRILNFEDYIYEYEEGDEEYSSGANDYKLDMVDQFVSYWAETHDGEEIEVVYDTFDTNETMFNELQTGKTTYDVIIPSDYMVQKLLSNDMLEPFDADELPELWENISPYLKDKFKNIKAGEESIYNYSVPYMWGTMGVMYNPEFYEDLDEDTVHELFKDWDSLYNEELKGSFSIKDSVRDTYAVSLIHNYRETIKDITSTEDLASIFNRSDADTMAEVKEDMLKLKENAFGFECDSGKTDMTTQKIGANMCWSGDAAWAITEAEEFGLTLYYSIPTSYNGEAKKSASNIWFDGFCMPKSDDLHKDLAQAFIKFMSQPINAAQNCYCVGYTPGVAGEEMLDYILGEYEASEALASYEEELEALPEKYDALREEINEKYEGKPKKLQKALEELEKEFFEEKTELEQSIADEQAWIDENKDTEENYYDLTYFYGDVEGARFLPCLGAVDRQLTAQYPSNEILDRLAIMNDFGPEGNARLLDMWEQVRTNALPTWAVVLLITEVVGGLAFAAYLIAHKVNRKRFKKERHS